MKRVGIGPVREQPRRAAAEAPMQLRADASRALLGELLVVGVALDEVQALAVTFIGGMVEGVTAFLLEF